MEIREIDFSEFHDLGHQPFSAYCRSQPGGWRNHLSLVWEYLWKPALAVRTSCKVGRHRMVTWNKTGTLETWRGCLHCLHKERSPRS